MGPFGSDIKSKTFTRRNNVLNQSINTFCVTLSSLLIISFPSLAATDSWEKARNSYTIYADGMYADILFYDLQTPRMGTQITSVEWDYANYDNGYDEQRVDICYRKEYQYTDIKCFNITELSTGSTDGFNGLDARGTVVLRYRLFGGNYAAYWPTGAESSVKVSYQY